MVTGWGRGAHKVRRYGKQHNGAPGLETYIHTYTSWVGGVNLVQAAAGISPAWHYRGCTWENSQTHMDTAPGKRQHRQG